MSNVIIIGGGAAGMMVAITLPETIIRLHLLKE